MTSPAHDFDAADGFGRGLAVAPALTREALLHVEHDAVAGEGLLHVEHDGDLVDGVSRLPVDVIDPNPRQPRQVFAEDALADLAASIREQGVLQPITVRRAPDGSGRFQVVMGERRLRACQAAGLTHVPALVREVPDEDMLLQAVLENTAREDLNVIEEGRAYRVLMTDLGLTQEQVAAKVGRSRARVSHVLGVLRLPAPVQHRIASGVLTFGHARELTALAAGDPEVVTRLATRVVEEGLSVQALREVIAIGNLPGAEDDHPRKPRTRGAAAKPQRMGDVERALGDWLDTRVQVVAGKNKGHIQIDFAGPEDLGRLLAVLGDPNQPLPPY